MQFQAFQAHEYYQKKKKSKSIFLYKPHTMPCVQSRHAAFTAADVLCTSALQLSTD